MSETQEDGTQAIVPVRQQVVDFYGDAIIAGQAADTTIYVPIRPICDALGLNWSGQRQRAQRDPVLAEALTECVIHTVQGDRAMLCLPLDLLPGWLFGIAGARVKPELQDKILRYRRECFRVLWNAFKQDILPAPAPPPADLAPVEQALALAEAVANLARQQLGYEGRLDQISGQLGTVADRQQVMADYLRGYIQQNEQRVTALELHLSAGAVISEAQAAELALHVKTVAAALEQRGTANGYQRVYSDLYRRFRIASYKNLPAARYQEALDWLRGWYDELQGGGDASPK